jgi:dUTP pyrophosphatase
MIIEIVEMQAMRQRPTRGSGGAAGFDLYADKASSGTVKVPPFTRIVFDTGVRVAIPAGFAGFIWPRSGLAVKQGLQVLGGLIDSDYRGEIKVCLFNGTANVAAVDTSKSIAQIVFQRHETPVFRSVSELPSTDRGEGRFGSTDGLPDPFPAFNEAPR